MPGRKRHETLNPLNDKHTVLRLPTEVYEELRKHAFEKRIPMNAFIIEALKEKLGLTIHKQILAKLDILLENKDSGYLR